MTNSNIKRGFKTRNNRFFRLSFSNVLLITFFLFLGYYLLSSMLVPGKGTTVTVDEFVSNIKNNRYAQVNIEYNGDAVAYGKYLYMVKDTHLDLENVNSTALLTKDTLEEKSVDEIINLLKNVHSKQKIKDAFLGGVNGIYEFVVFDDAIIARTHDKNKDYIIRNITEDEFKDRLIASGFKMDNMKINWSFARSASRLIETDEFVNIYKDGRFEAVFVFDNIVAGKLKENEVIKNNVNWKSFTDDFSKFLQNEGIDFSSPNVEILSVYNPPFQIDTLLWIGAIGIMLFAVSMLVKAMQGQGNSLMQFGQSKARLFWGKKSNVTFKDVAGIDEAKEELKEIVMFLKNPKKFTKLGARIPKGVLMVGPPGTGKTLLAKAIAGEAGVPFFHTSGSEFEEMLVGAGASRVRDLFKKAKRTAPSLIFIDEIDAIARKRGTTIQSSHTEQTLNQILVEMDGFEPNQNVIVIAATNRPDVLDPAILRPGRFDRRVVLDLPDIEGRKEILAIHAKNKPLAEDVDLEVVAKRTVGFSGADLENMLNEAAIITAKDGRKKITMADIEEAATKVMAGPEKKRKRDKKELEMTAYHEAGHAIVAKLTPKTDPVHRITIISRGMALGWTMQLPEKDKYQQTKEEILAQIRVLMGGRAAEEIIFKDITSGASNDIEKATSLARKMVKRFGMSSKLGLVKYGQNNELQYLGYGYGEQKDYSEKTAQLIDDEVKNLIEHEYKQAKRILMENMNILKKLVDLLLEKEVVEAEEFNKLFKS